MDVLRDRAGLSNIRLIILVFVVLSGIAAALLYFPPIQTRTAPLKTSGDIKFMDSAGNPLSGALALSGDGVSSGPPKPNVNLISWDKIPNAIINYDDFATKSLSISLRISGDSPKGTVVLENYGTALPGSVNITAPGMPVKYVEINSSGVSFADADISIKYTDAEVSGLDVNNLVIYQYDSVSEAWNELPISLDTGNNLLTATVNALGFFAVSTRIPHDIEVIDTEKLPVVSDIKTYDEAKTLKKEAKTDKLSTADVPDRGELEVDALDSKNVAVRLKVNKANKGKVILDDFGKRNPAPAPLPGMAVKFVEIGASGISFSSADITIRYTDADLNGGSEDALTIYHWNGASWDAVPTSVDKVNKTLSASTASLSLWGVATLYQKALRCDTGTSIGVSDTTDTACATASYTVFSTGLLLDPAGITGGYILLPAFSGEGLNGYFVDNTAYSTDVNITGVNGSMSMRLAATGITAYGKYQVGYYNPNGAADNFVGLFNSTETSAITTTTQTKYPVSFYAANKSAIIPKNMKLAIRAWTRTSASGQVRFYLYRTTAAYASLFNYTLAYANSTISGYVTNKSSGLPLIGATVQTNTSLTTTTNASGGYNFTGLSNGTYNINASLTNYAVNSINVTINDNNNNTANISLTPLPTYLLSGYVTNASNGAAISGATVTTNTSQTTTTNATGYYNFTLSNGTYLITASMTNYNDNSTTRTVSGAAVSNANIMLTPVPPSVGKILVATNRYVILDDPGIGRTPGSGFSNPAYDFTTSTGGNWNYWSGKNTRINATVLYIDNNGFPVNGQNITFTLYDPGGGVNATNYSTTNALGLANVSFDLNGTEYYGKWQIKAGYGTLNDSTTFIYNWWGCATSETSCSNSGTGHPNNPGTITAVTNNSPYLNGKDTTTSQATQHTGSNCTICHQSFDGLPGGNTLTVNHTDNTSDVHRNVSGGCRNANCHGSYTTHNTNQVIGSCYNASGGCHGNGSAWDRKDLSNKSTLNSANVATALSEYSINSTDFNATFHNPNSTIPCIICHGPMHNITKPDESLRFIRNNNTEDSQCKACHSSYTEHNSSNTTSGGVNCTLCHSDDVHDIQVFAQNATYVDLNHDNPNPARGNCTNCHQNATFFAALEKQPKAGNYTGRDPPIIPVPLNHSTDPMSGALWNGTQSRYWDNTSQKSACYYCHGNTTHSTSALGSIGNVRGTNNLNHDLTTSRWCANCHYKNAPDYAGTNFSPEPPEIQNASGKVPATSRDGTTFTNHSNYFTSGYNDSVCKNCHNNNLSASATSLNFSHNVNIGSGGAPNCIQCHNLVTGLSGGAPVGVNFTAVNLSVHYGINSQNATNWSYVAVVGACWACHDTDGNVSTGHPDKYKTPKTCADCHLASGTYYNQSVKWGLNVTVSEHYYSGDQIVAGNSSSDISSCINCHENVSEMIVYNNDTNYGSFAGDGVRLTGGNMSFYHYGRDRSDIRTGATADCTYCHRNTSTAFNIAMSDPAYSKNVSNHSMSYSSSNPGCSQCHNSGWIHNSTLTKPNLTLPNSTYCLTCHGTGGTASIKNLAQHDGTVNCTDCHLNTSRSIHPVRYLQQDGTNWSTSRTNAVNCTTCHQGQGLTNFSSAPKIPTPMNHSTNIYNGSLWNSTPGYWTNTSPQSACNYCHNKSALHNASGLGNISLIQAGNSKNQSLSSGYWCANCHYNGSAASGNYSYKGNLFSPQPPEVYNKSGLVPATARDGTSFFNHSGSIATYDDARCRNCHNAVLGAGTTSLYFSHDARSGGGGPNCTQCHDISGTGAPDDKRINASAMRLGVHRNLNSNATNTTAIDPVNKACWACHGDGIQPNGHPVNKSNPWSCPDCHNRTVRFNSSNLTLQTDITRKTVVEHIPDPYFESLNSTVWNTAVNCTACHNKSTVYFNVTFTAVNYIAANVSHYANTSNLISPTINCTICHKSPTNSQAWYANLTRHPAKSQNYTFCANCHNTTNATDLHSQPLVYTPAIHGGISNVSGVTESFDGFDFEKDDYKDTGAVSGTESCIACHGSASGTGTPKLCENCHLPNTTSLFTGPNQSALYNLRSDINETLPYVYSHTNYSSQTGTNITVPSQYAAGMTYQTTCYGYNTTTGAGSCHGTSYSNSPIYGGYYAQYDSVPTVKSDPAHWTDTIDRMPNTTNCLFCHNQSDQTVRKAWGNATQVNASTMFGATTSVSCYACHTTTGTQPFDFHSNEVVTGGGPGCLDCHNNTNRKNYSGLHYIDGTNYSNSIHAKMNSNNASGYGINASCWACHNSTGTVVPNNTHPDRRDTPYICTDCHLASGSNAGAFNATIVSNHYRNGTNIRALDNRTSDLISCLGCHENVSRMITPNNDTDYGSFASDGVGVKGGNTSFYHYGANRSNFGKSAGSYDYCIYCHKNTTGEFNSTFQDAANYSISNHSSNYNSSNPTCSDALCHNSTSSTLHGSRLAKPELNMPNSTYCLSCHGKNSTNGTNYTGAVTSYKERHNNLVDCTNCHLNSSKSIHPVRYLGQDGSTWSTTNNSAVNCTNCHQGSGLTGFENAPKVANPMAHSDNISNGSRWNTTKGYWTNTSQQSMCNYCHGDSRHNATALGRPANWNGSNTLKSSITSNSNWCAGCHYQGYSNSGRNYSSMTSTFEGANKSVPPEITNYTSYAPYTVSGYYNHSLTPDYNDTTCKGCHNRSLPSDAKIKEFVHNVSTGVCTNCHFDYSYMSSSGAPTRFVNKSMYEASPHGRLRCEDCHTKGHNNIGARKACEDCHAVQNPNDKRDRHNITRTPSTYYYNGINVLNITDCTVCHDSTLYNNATANYGYNKTIDCNYCHTYPDKTYS